MLVSLVLPPFLVHRMAPAEYSAWVLILQLSAYVNMLDLGLQTAIGKFVAEYDAKGDREASHHLVSTSFTILAVAAAIGFAAIAVMVWSVPRLFHQMPARLVPKCVSRCSRLACPLRSAAVRYFSFHLHWFAAICFSHHRRHRQPSRISCRTHCSSAYAWQPGAIGAGHGGIQFGNGGNAVLWLAKVCEGASRVFIPVVPPPIRDPTGKIRQCHVHLDTGHVLCQRPGYRDRRPLPVQRYRLLRHCQRRRQFHAGDRFQRIWSAGSCRILHASRAQRRAGLAIFASE